MNDDRFNSRETIRKLDGLGPRVAKEDDAVRVQQARPENYRDGFRPAHPEGHRKVDIRKLKEIDPALAFFLVSNRDPQSA